MSSIPDFDLQSSETYQALTDIRTGKGVPTLIDDIYERIHEIARLRGHTGDLDSGIHYLVSVYKTNI
jgi:hypothetical protein